MTNRRGKNCPVSPVVREIKATDVTSHPLERPWSDTQKGTSVGKDVEEGTPRALLVGTRAGAATVGSRVGLLRK